MVHAHFERIPLEGVLGEQGFKHVAEQTDEDHWRPFQSAMSIRAQPGTLAHHNPEPELVTQVRALVANGTRRRDVVSMLTAKELDRDEVRSDSYWVRQMSGFAWDDHTGTHVLMILEDVLREIPGGK